MQNNSMNYIPCNKSGLNRHIRTGCILLYHNKTTYVFNEETLTQTTKAKLN